MRAGVVAVLIAVGVAIAPSASAGVFPDLPGLDAAERLTGSSAPAAPKGDDTTVSNVTTSERVPTPTSASVAEKVTTSDDKLFIRNLPGGEGIPVLGDQAEPASSDRGTVAGLAALALLVVVLYTRFLVRLNTFGRRASA